MKILNRHNGDLILEIESLIEANLYGADLRGAKGIYQFGPVTSSGRICFAVWQSDHWMIQAGCFWGEIEELEEKVRESHNCPVYLGNIEFLKSYQPK